MSIRDFAAYAIECDNENCGASTIYINHHAGLGSLDEARADGRSVGFQTIMVNGEEKHYCSRHTVLETDTPARTDHTQETEMNFPDRNLTSPLRRATITEDMIKTGAHALAGGEDLFWEYPNNDDNRSEFLSRSRTVLEAAYVIAHGQNTPK